MDNTRTFRDHFLSVFQSAASDFLSQAPAATTESAPEDPEVFMDAVNEVAALRFKDQTELPDIEEGIADIPKICASLGLRYLEALVLGDHARAERIKEQMTAGSTCDPGWASTLKEYAKNFGPNGTRAKIPYIRAAVIGERTIPVAAGARIAVFGDWGTGAGPARRVLSTIAGLKPDVLLHLGDIYYSGTPTECRANFVDVIRSTIDHPIPVFTLAGNHDMYSGGVGYYELVKQLNSGDQAQGASFFCLRSTDQAWQILAMDTGLHDYSPLSVTDALTFVEEDEQEWLERRVAEFAGRTILVSHHQPFSAFSQIGKPRADGSLLAYNPNLRSLFERLKTKGEIAAWLWGHEHNLCIFGSYLGLERGRCIGHGAIPIFADEKPYAPLKGLQDHPQLLDGTQLQLRDGSYEHGFAMISLGRDGAQTTIEYFGRRRTPRRYDLSGPTVVSLQLIPS